jgi:ABC-2 type transport system permease protein
MTAGPMSNIPGPFRRNPVGIVGWRYALVGIGIPLSFYLLYTVLGLAAAGRAGDDGWAGQFMVSMAALAAAGAALAAGSKAALAPADGNLATRLTPKGQLAGGLALVGPPLIAVCVAGALVNEVRLPPASWLDLLASLWVGAIPFLVLGLILGRLVHPDAAGVVVLGLAITLGVLGGLFQPVASLPPLMVSVAGALPSYHLASLGWSAIAGQAPMPVDIAALAAYTVALIALLGWTAGDETGRADG